VVPSRNVPDETDFDLRDGKLKSEEGIHAPPIVLNGSALAEI
jgi:hypothetical protein